MMTRRKPASRKIALIGAGKIGKLAALLLGKKYDVTVYDINEERARETASAVCEYGQHEMTYSFPFKAALRFSTWLTSSCPNLHTAPAVSLALSSLMS